MSSFIVFIIIAIVWAVVGSLKAAADRVGSPTRPNPYQMKKETEMKAFAPPPAKPPEKHRPNVNDNRGNRSFLKREDAFPDFIDKTEVDTQSASSQKSKEAKNQVELAPFLKGNLLRESIILSECLDRPRAYRPHPLNKHYNLLERRD